MTSCCRVKFTGQDAPSTGFGAKRYKGITWRISHGVEEETLLTRKVRGARCPVYGVWREALQGDHVENLAWGGGRNLVDA